MNIVRSMKKYRFYFIATFSIFAGSALLYFLVKLIIPEYNLIGAPIDNLIPFVPVFIYLYMIWYPFEILSLFFIFKYNKDTYLKTIITLAVSLLIAQIIFLIYPTTINRPIIESYNNLTEFIVYLTYKSDTPVNCFPSIHCIICFHLIYCTLSSSKLPKKYFYTIIIINILIIISTLLVKQHVLYDVIGSLLISSISYYLISKSNFFIRIEKKLAKVC